MHYREACQVLAEGEPAPEDMCDIACGCCAGEWSSIQSSIYRLGDDEPTVYKNYVGHENCEYVLSSAGGYQEMYQCPNCSKDGDVVFLYNIAESGNLGPHDRYKLAQLIVEEHDLQNRLKSVIEEIRQYI